ncbi:MAG: ribosome maturation factor RimM [Plesiomonas sp.]|jgi:16S rRNA processing protein RimM|uniref:ribosome maturation factor RimM n=1 Tax=Plesiomonas sp. TaxID=2486279 RepID=UPI003EE7FC98
MSKLLEPVVLGKLGSTYGIRGWLRVYSSTENSESIFAYQPWYLKIRGQWCETELESWRHHNSDLIVKLKGIDDREAAHAMTNVEIAVEASQLPALDNGDYYWRDLMGCKVVNVSGYEFGKIIDMMETGSNDVMVVKANLNDAFGVKERLIPFLDGQVIKKVDLAAQTIEVEWDPGF